MPYCYASSGQVFGHVNACARNTHNPPLHGPYVETVLLILYPDIYLE